MDRGLVFTLWFVLIVFAGIVTAAKGRSLHWLWLGVSPFSALVLLIVMAFLPELKKCPKCGKVKIRAEWAMCPDCQNSTVPTTLYPYPNRSAGVRGQIRGSTGKKPLLLHLLLPDSLMAGVLEEGPAQRQDVHYRASVVTDAAEDVARVRGRLLLEPQPKVEIECPASGLLPGVYNIALEAKTGTDFEEIAMFSFQLLEEEVPEAPVASESGEKKAAAAD